MYSQHLKEWGVMFHLLEGRASVNYLIFFCARYLPSLSHSFIHSVIYLCQYGLINIYFVHCVIIHSYFIYFISQIILALAIGNFFIWLLFPFEILSSLGVFWFVLFFSVFLLFSSYSKLALFDFSHVSESAIPPRNPCFLHWGIIFET